VCYKWGEVANTLVMLHPFLIDCISHGYGVNGFM